MRPSRFVGAQGSALLGTILGLMLLALPTACAPRRPDAGRIDRPRSDPGGTAAARDSAHAGAAALPRILAFVGGRWFSGEGFAERTGYTVDGRLLFDRPAHVDSTVDLDGGYVIPPFGEAHNHNVEPSSRLEATIARYLHDGVFYVQNPNNLPGARGAMEGLIDVPTGVDVSFANGGLTGPGGHPILVVQRNIDRGAWTVADGEGAFYFTIRDTTELARRWGSIVATHPDFIKTYLLYADSAAAGGSGPAPGWSGLDPRVLPAIVRRAHDAGLRVAAHIETARDFHHAVAAGVDQIAHMPGFRGDPDVRLPDPRIFEIADADARRAARAGVTVVTTIGGVRDMDPAGPDSSLRMAFDRLHRRNVRLLQARGIRLAIGSDDYGDTSVGEATYLHALGVLDNRALLKLWAEATPQAIFPHRRIGCLRTGCEASFLVLRGDPLLNFASVRDIALRVKDGRLLPPPVPQ